MDTFEYRQYEELTRPHNADRYFLVNKTVHRLTNTLLTLAIGSAITLLGLMLLTSDADAARSKQHKREHYADATRLVISAANRYHVPKALALKIAKYESGLKCGLVGDQGRSYGPLQIQIRTARALFGIRAVNRLGCAAQTDLGMRHLAMAFRMSGGSWCGTAVKHNGGLGAKGGNWMTRVYANSVIGGCFKATHK
jgi:hypothetical protein